MVESFHGGFIWRLLRGLYYASVLDDYMWLRFMSMISMRNDIHA